MYENLLERCACHQTRYLAPPRALVDALVILTQPHWGEIIHDPCAGTGSFLVAAAEYIELMRKDETKHQSLTASPSVFLGAEKTERQRFARMNCLLHQPHTSCHFHIYAHHCLSLYEQTVDSIDVLLSLLLPATSMADHLTESLDLLEYAIHTLKAGGRASIIVPDEVLNAQGYAHHLRCLLLDTCVLHTVLRLPLHTFHSQLLATHVLFFYRSHDKTERTATTWFYDLRSGQSLLQSPLNREYLLPFEKAFGDNPWGQAVRQAEGENGRWRCFNRAQLALQDNNLDVCWLQALDTPENHLHQVVSSTIQELEMLVTILSDEQST
jgi:type I restriction enzyme M protein